jgi:perosamine synthetase
VNNGTSALILSLFAQDIGIGDDVIVPDFTMVATANAVSITGANIIFSDVNPETGCIDLKSITDVVTKKTRALMLVTINGRYPKDIDNIISFCKKNKIIIIEDAAQSLGSYYKNTHLGLLGDLGCISFSMPKIISTGNGGAIITDDEKLFKRIQKLRDFGREAPGGDKYLTMGWNFKFTDIQAVIGIAQMGKLDKFIRRKKEIFSSYKDGLSSITTLKFMETNLVECTPMFTDIYVKSNQRNKLAEYLSANQIATRFVYPALHSEKVFNIKKRFPGAEEIAASGLWLPSSTLLSDKDIEHVILKIKSFFKKLN